MKKKKTDFLKEPIEHIDIKKHNVVSLVDSMSKMAFQARNIANAARIYDRMLADEKCSIILTLAGSLFSAGLKRVVVDMIENNMVDCIVSTGAIIVDQDFFEALGFKHYIGTPRVDDNELRELAIDRIYDTYIDEDNLRDCDETVSKILDTLEPRAYSSREIIYEMGKYLDKHGVKSDGSVVHAAYKHGVPIFVPAFSDCSAGFGFVIHQTKNHHRHVTLDSARDFLELTQLKIAAKDTGLLMIGGGVPKNFAQDTVVAADILKKKVPMHKYAVQLTVADERDGGLSGSTLKEACSWGKVQADIEQMVFVEATIGFPLVAAYAYHKSNWKKRARRNFQQLFLKKGECPAHEKGGKKTTATV